MKKVDFYNLLKDIRSLDLHHYQEKELESKIEEYLDNLEVIEKHYYDETSKVVLIYKLINKVYLSKHVLFAKDEKIISALLPKYNILKCRLLKYFDGNL